MHAGWRVLQVILTILTSIALLFGAFSLSLVEGSIQQPNITQPPDTSEPVATTPQPKTTHPVVFTITWQPSASFAVSATPLPPTSTPTLPSTPTNCPVPVTWLPYIVQPGDTLADLAIRAQSTISELSAGNCLLTTSLIPGQLVYLPPFPTQTPHPTNTHIPCGPPASWVIYYVQQGDTLYHLGQAFGIPWTDIQIANCLTSSNLIIGQRIYVPPWATRTPSPTFPGFPTLTDTTPFYWTETPFETPTTLPTDTETSTDIPVPSPTETVPTP